MPGWIQNASHAFSPHIFWPSSVVTTSGIHRHVVPCDTQRISFDRVLPRRRHGSAKGTAPKKNEWNTRWCCWPPVWSQKVREKPWILKMSISRSIWNLGLWTWGLRNFLVAATLVIQEPQLLRSQLDLQGAEEGRSRDRGCLNVLFGATSHTGTSRNMFFLNISSSTTNINVDMWHIHYCHASYTMLYHPIPIGKIHGKLPHKPISVVFQLQLPVRTGRLETKVQQWLHLKIFGPLFSTLSILSHANWANLHPFCPWFLMILCIVVLYVTHHAIIASVFCHHVIMFITSSINFFLPIKNIFWSRWPLPHHGANLFERAPIPKAWPSTVLHQLVKVRSTLWKVKTWGSPKNHQ